MDSGRSKKKTFLLCLFFGYLGFHRYYVGKMKTGFLYMLTLGLFGIGWIADLIAISHNSFTDSFGLKITGDTHKPIAVNAANIAGAPLPIARASQGTTISDEDRAKLLIPDNGYTLKYHYTDVEICWFLDRFKIPECGIKPGNRVIFYQEPNNPYDNKAVLLMFVPQKKPFGYLHRGKIQDMVNEYIRRDDKVVARVSYYQFKPQPKMKIDIAFFTRNQKKPSVNKNKTQLKKSRCTFKATSDFFDVFHNIVVLDTETTGLSNNDRIIEISMLKVENGKIKDRFSTLVAPGMPISQKIVKITGITNEMLEKSKPISNYQKQIKSFIGDNIIVGHNLPFDLRFLNRELNERLNNRTIDTLKISHEILPNLSHHGLKDIASYYSIDYTGAHRSERDCEITLECLDNLTQGLSKSDIQKLNGVK